MKTLRSYQLVAPLTGFVVSLILFPVVCFSATPNEDLGRMIAGSPVFYQKLSAIGDSVPPEEENQVLWDEIQKISAHGFAPSIPALEQFVETRTNSPWRLSLQANLGQYYREHGRYTKALALWEHVWQAIRDAKDGPAKLVGDFTFAHWTELLCSLGRLDKLGELFGQTQGRIFDAGPLQQIVLNNRESYQMMLRNPGVCFKCGTFALDNVARALKGSSLKTRSLLEIPSPRSGFTMGQLMELADTNHLDLVPCEWSAEHKLVVPSIVHWKQDHYAAVLEQREGWYLVADPTFGGPQWLERSVILDEATGRFLVPRDRLPTGWNILAAAETHKIIGRGYASSATDPNDACQNGSGGGDSSGSAGGQLAPGSSSDQACSSCSATEAAIGAGGRGPRGGPGGSGGSGSGGSGGGGGGTPVCCPDDGSSQGGNTQGSGNIPPPGASASWSGLGAPVWSVSEPYINVWLYDQPIPAETGLGRKANFKLSYKQRSTRAHPSGLASLGNSWECSWLGYTIDYVYFPIVELAGGGERTYNTTHEYLSGTTAQRTVDGGSHLQGFTVTHPDGSLDCYGLVATLGGSTIALLTEQADAFGHTNKFQYDQSTGNALLKYVIDADGRTNTLSYTNVSFPTLITSVQDPFGRTAYMKYNENGTLTNIIDCISLSSSFKYNENGWVTNLATPYGTTSFSYYTNTPASPGTTEFDQGDRGPWFITRAVTIVDPVGGTNIFMLRQDSSQIYTNETDYANHPDYAVPFLADTISDPAILPSSLPVTPNFDSTHMNYRNSFHWGPRQASGLPTDLNMFLPPDYRKARRSHWLHDRYVSAAVGQALNMRQDPSPDGPADGQTIWFDYPDKPADYWVGAVPMPNLVAAVLPNGQNWYRILTRDEWYRPTNIIESYSLASGGTVLDRTNVYVYNGSDLQKHIGPYGEIQGGYGYDGTHQLTSFTNAVGDVTTMTYDGAGRLASTKTPAGLNIDNIYFPSGEYTNWVQKRIDRELGRTNSFTYVNNLVQTHTDERGNITTNVWDNLNRLVTTSDARGTNTFIYNKLDLAQAIDRLGYTNSYGYDALRRMIARTNALGFYTLFSYCACGSLDSVTDNEGHTTSYLYGNDGRRLVTSYADGYSVTNNFNLISQLTNTADTFGTKVTNWFNNQGLVCTISNYFGQVSKTISDVEDRVTNSVYAYGVVVADTVDALGRVLIRTYPDLGTESFGYSNGALVAYTNEIGNVTRYAYNEALWKRFETNANTEVIELRYNSSGSLTNLIDGRGQITYWQFDQYNRATNKEDNLGSNLVIYSYSALDQLTNRWTPGKGNTRYTYSAANNLTNINYPSSPDVAFGWDAMNRCTNMVDAVGTTVYTFDSVGELLTEDGPFASDTVTNTYANRQRVALALAQPTGYWTNGFSWDPAKRLTNVGMSAGNFSYLYSATQHRLITNLGLPNTSVITNGFDSNARLLTTSLNNSSGTPLDSYTYIYDPANERTNLTRTDASTVAFKYDKIGQLTVADSSVNTEDRGYFYDAAWNLNRRTNNGTPMTFTVESRNELTNVAGNSITYDFNGNISTYVSPHYIYTYDDENRLIYWTHYAVNSSTLTDGDWQTAFVYDGRGRLRERFEYRMTCNVIEESGPQGIGDPDLGGAGGLPLCDWVLQSETTYIYDGNRVIQERNGTNNTPLVTYTRGTDLSGTFEGAGGIGGMLARSSGYSSGNWTTNNYYHADGNGNITYLVNSVQTGAATYRYDPFGNLISSAGTLASANVYRFSSKEFMVNSGMYYYLYRFYDPNLQRWISRDPVHELGFIVSENRKHGWHQSAELNLYDLVLNNSNNKLDPLGLTKWGPLGGSCCNDTGHDEWWLDDGQWKKLPTGGCTGVLDDCDGMTCNGRFFVVPNVAGMSCHKNRCPQGGWGPGGPTEGGAWPPGPPYPGYTGPTRGAPNADPPPGYQWRPFTD